MIAIAKHTYERLFNLPAPTGAFTLERKKEMDIKEAMKIVAYNVIVNGNEEIELALQTVEKTLGLEPVLSHGNGESFHYKDLEIE